MAPNESSHMREDGLRRLVLARRWIVAASVTLTGVLAAVAASAFPGKTIKQSGVPATGQTSSGESSESSSGAVTPPEQAPQSSEGQASAPAESGQPSQETPVVSGGS